MPLESEQNVPAVVTLFLHLTRELHIDEATALRLIELSATTKVDDNQRTELATLMRLFAVA